MSSPAPALYPRPAGPPAPDPWAGAATAPAAKAPDAWQGAMTAPTQAAAAAGEPKKGLGAWLREFGQGVLEGATGASGWGDVRRGITEGLPYMVEHPIDSAEMLGGAAWNAQKQQFHQAEAALHSPVPEWARLSEAAGHAAAGAIPLIGPAAANAGETMGSPGQENAARGLGESAGLLGAVALNPEGRAGEGASRAAAEVTPRLADWIRARMRAPLEEGGPDSVAPSTAEVAAHARAEGIEPTAAELADSPQLRLVQKTGEGSLAGAGDVKTQMDATRAQMTGAYQHFLDRVAPKEAMGRVRAAAQGALDPTEEGLELQRMLDKARAAGREAEAQQFANVHEMVGDEPVEVAPVREAAQEILDGQDWRGYLRDHPEDLEHVRRAYRQLRSLSKWGLPDEPEEGLEGGVDALEGPDGEETGSEGAPAWLRDQTERDPRRLAAYRQAYADALEKMRPYQELLYSPEARRALSPVERGDYERLRGIATEAANHFPENNAAMQRFLADAGAREGPEGAGVERGPAEVETGDELGEPREVSFGEAQRKRSFLLALARQNPDALADLSTGWYERLAGAVDGVMDQAAREAGPEAYKAWRGANLYSRELHEDLSDPRSPLAEAFRARDPKKLGDLVTSPSGGGSVVYLNKLARRIGGVPDFLRSGFLRRLGTDRDGVWDWSQFQRRLGPYSPGFLDRILGKEGTATARAVGKRALLEGLVDRNANGAVNWSAFPGQFARLSDEERTAGGLSAGEVSWLRNHAELARRIEANINPSGTQKALQGFAEASGALSGAGAALMGHPAAAAAGFAIPAAGYLASKIALSDWLRDWTLRQGPGAPGSLLRPREGLAAFLRHAGTAGAGTAALAAQPER